jgi:hypothetical protein
MTMRLVTATAMAAVLAAQLSFGFQGARPVDPVTAWSVAAQSAAASSGMAPLRIPITLALVHLAMYDAVHAIVGERKPYHPGLAVMRPASAEAAAIEAGYRIALAEMPSQTAALGAKRDEWLASVPAGTDKTNGIAVGAATAQRLLALRANDGRNAAVPFTPSGEDGAWVPTPPAFLPATTTFLAHITPFTMDAPWQFRPSGPPPLDSKRWARDYNEVKALGVRVGSQRSGEQTATALFWEPLAGTVWPATIRRLAAEQFLDLPASAHFQAAAFAAFADSLIACWDAKFHFQFWRPVTAIQHGDQDGNPQTAPDPVWEPLAVTPNFSEYPSGHTCATAAVAQVIEDYFPHGVQIPARNVVTGEDRLYRKASDIVDEVIEARMLLGVHFRSGNEDGADVGRKVARQIRSRWFKRQAS